MKQIFRIKRAALCFMVAALLILCACGSSSAPGENRHEVVFAASTTTGSFYQFCVPCCEIVSKYSETINLTAITTTGTKEGFDLMKIAEVDAAGGPGIMAYYAYTGQSSWLESGPVDFSIAYVGYPDYVQIAVPNDSDIYSVSDLSGKRVCVQYQGNTASMVSELVFEALGIDGHKPVYLEYSDGMSGVQDGSVDAIFYVGGLGPSVLMEFAAARSGMRLVAFSEEECDIISSYTDGVLKPRVIPAGYYSGIEDEILTIGSSVPICVSNDLPDAVVYEIVKALEENHDELASSISSASYATAANTVEEWGDSAIPLHPGAMRYFRELGLIE